MNLCKKGISMKEEIFIKKNKTLNEFLNIKRIEDKFLYTLDKQMISFIRVYPINTELFSEEELVQKMNSASVEFSNEQKPYSIFVIPRKVDITDFIKEQESLKKKVKDKASIEIIEKRIIATHEMVANKNIIENEFYLCIWENVSEDTENKIEKRAIDWKNRLKQCDLESEILEKTEIILLIKSFTIPEFARKESVDYDDSIIKIRRKVVRNK